MHFPSSILQALAKTWLFFYLLIPFVIIYGNKYETMISDNNVISVGAIVDVNSRTGKEQLVAMDIAAQSYNNSTSNNHKLALYFWNSTKDPLRAIKLG